MIRSVKIKCPLCGEESELFLSINPTVIILNCPECWTPLMYANDDVRILSEKELHTIMTPAPTSESVLENIFDKTMQRKQSTDLRSGYGHDIPFTPSLLPIASAVNQSGRVITKDDIVDLRIELERCDDVLKFIENL